MAGIQRGPRISGSVTMANVPWHLLALAHGIGAGVACLGFFYLCGLAIVPRDGGGAPAQEFRFDASPAVLGAAVYVLLCWFGIRLKIPLNTTSLVFSTTAVVLVVARRRAVVEGLRARQVMSRATLGWCLAFALLYSLGYVFFTPPMSRDFLPLASYANLDLYNYLVHTRHFQTLGPSNIVGFSYVNVYYHASPAVFYLFAFFSVLFGRDPLAAAMPLQFACAGLIGLTVARMSHAAFRVPRVWAVAVGCVLVSGPFFRYVEGNYFLSTLMALPVLLHLLWITAGERPGRRLVDPPLVIHFWAHHVLLVFLYPPFLVAGLVLQAIILSLVAVASIQSEPAGRAGWGAHVKRFGRSAAAVAMALIGLVAVDPGHFAASMNWVRYLALPGVAGWPLDLVSPRALFGVPGHFDLITVRDKAHRPWAIAALCLIAIGLTALFWWRCRRSASVTERTFAAFGAGSIVAYCAYFLRLGPSYQQWKFASYFTLPMTFAVFAGFLRLLVLSPAGSRAMATRRGRLLAAGLVVAAASGFVGGNILVHARHEPPLRRIEGGLRSLALIDGIPSFKELVVQLEAGPATFLAPYFIRTKVLHLASASYFPHVPTAPEWISKQRPLLLHRFNCPAAGHDDTVTIPGVGCLLLAPPSVSLDRVYPFSQSFRPVRLTGFAGREPWGCWNESTTVELMFRADGERIPIHRDMFLNLQLEPYRLPRLEARTLRLSWGAGWDAVAVLRDREWVSLPVRARDWSGEPKYAALTVSVSLPDAVPLNAADPRSTDARPIAVGFLDLSFSTAPAGRVVASPSEPVR